MNASFLWLASFFILPASVILASFSRMELRELRRLTVILSAALLVLTLGHLRSPYWSLGPFRVDSFSGVLLPFTAALWLFTVAATPRATLDRETLRRTTLTTWITLTTFLTEKPLFLLFLWIISIHVFLQALSAPEHRHSRQVAKVYLGASTISFSLGVFLLSKSLFTGAFFESMGIALIALAALIRKGIFPFHAWIPEVFDQGRLGPAILFSAPQIGAYASIILVIPVAPEALLHSILFLSLITSVYGAALALVQTDARRACGYLFVSQSALVMAGLDCSSTAALTGGLILWISSGLAFGGLSRCVLVLEVRRGRLDLSKRHGGYERMPLLAISFLLMGLACTGFPGTLGFIGEELLLGGAVEEFPILGFAVVITGAFTGLAVLRMYFSLFCGRKDTSLHLRLLSREAFAFGAIAAFLISMGMAPSWIIQSRMEASKKILQHRLQIPEHENKAP